MTEAAAQSAAFQDVDRLSHWLDEVRRATLVEERVIQEEDPFGKPLFMTEENV